MTIIGALSSSSFSFNKTNKNSNNNNIQIYNNNKNGINLQSLNFQTKIGTNLLTESFQFQGLNPW